MTVPLALCQSLESAAWDRYTLATARSAQVAGSQFDLFDTAMHERVEWLGIVLACAAESDRLMAASRAVRHG